MRWQRMYLFTGLMSLIVHFCQLVPARLSERKLKLMTKFVGYDKTEAHLNQIRCPIVVESRSFLVVMSHVQINLFFVKRSVDSADTGHPCSAMLDVA